MNVLKYKNNGGKQKPHKFKIDNNDFTELHLCLQLRSRIMDLEFFLTQYKIYSMFLFLLHIVNIYPNYIGSIWYLCNIWYVINNSE